jgi:hypothetical protein
MTDPNAPPHVPPPHNEGPLTDATPKRPEGQGKTWVQAIGITLAVIGGVLGVLLVIALAVVGLVLWTCSSH